jgi:alcohol dehydrogenase class IV
MNFEFATAQRIVFGAGKLGEVGPMARGLGGRALVVTGRSGTRAERLRELLSVSGVQCRAVAIPGEPTLAMVEAGVAEALAHGCDLVIGFGGGSALDAAKAIAALATNPGPPTDYLEVIGKGQALREMPLPCLAIPTTAGTGSEATRNAVITVPDHQVKVSLRHAWMLPRVALVDPELTLGLPAAITAATGMDALTQVIEPFVCSRSNPMVDALCAAAIPRAWRALPQAFRSPADLRARGEMCFASLSGGIALANAGLGAVHGFASPIGGMYAAPHGAVCAALLAPVTRTNVEALRRRAPGSPALARYTQLAQWFLGDSSAEAAQAWEPLAALARELNIPGLRAYGVQPGDVPLIVGKARQASSMKANPIELDETELAGILSAAL